MDREWWWSTLSLCNSTRSSTGYNFAGAHKNNLAYAVERNTPLYLKELLETGGGINLTDSTNDTLIHYAVEMNRLEILEALLDVDGAPINAKNFNSEETPLLLALRRSLEPLATKLIEKGADINLVDSRGHSPLLHAISNRCLQASKLLIEKGADINFGDDLAAIPLFMACRNQWIEGVCMLLYYGVDVSVATTLAVRTPFRVASLELQEILFDYIFDEYKVPIRLSILLDAVISRSPLLDKLFQNVSQVLYNEGELDVLVYRIPRMNPHYLKLLSEQFEDAVKDLILNDDFLSAFSSLLKSRCTSTENISTAIENLCFLVNGFSSCLVKSLNMPNRNPYYRFTLGDFLNSLDALNDYQLQEVMALISQLLMEGVRINHFDCGVVYVKYGYCPLFRQMILMDIGNEYMSRKRKYLMPQLIYDVKITVEEFLLNNDDYDFNYLHLVLEHFCHPQLKEIFLQVNDKFERKVMELPQVPLLVELARNVTRKHIIDVYKIEHFRRLKEVLEILLPERLKKILTYEEKLYK